MCTNTLARNDMFLHQRWCTRFERQTKRRLYWQNEEVHSFHAHVDTRNHGLDKHALFFQRHILAKEQISQTHANSAQVNGKQGPQGPPGPAGDCPSLLTRIPLCWSKHCEKKVAIFPERGREREREGKSGQECYFQSQLSKLWMCLFPETSKRVMLLCAMLCHIDVILRQDTERNVPVSVRLMQQLASTLLDIPQCSVLASVCCIM